jgi:hypothetical protein
MLKTTLTPSSTVDNRLSYLAITIKLFVIVGATGALLYRWKAENAHLLLLVVGFFMGFLLTLLRGSLSKRK